MRILIAICSLTLLGCSHSLRPDAEDAISYSRSESEKAIIGTWHFVTISYGRVHEQNLLRYTFNDDGTFEYSVPYSGGDSLTYATYGGHWKTGAGTLTRSWPQVGNMEPKTFKGKLSFGHDSILVENHKGILEAWTRKPLVMKRPF